MKQIAWKAQRRLHTRYGALSAPSKCKQQVVAAIGREPLGFIFDPVELLERLAVLIPRPPIKLLLFHGVLGSRAAWRALPSDADLGLDQRW